MSERSRPTTVVTGSRTGANLYVLYCRIAAVTFGLVAAYTLTVKLPRGGLAHDWLHTVLHVVTGAVAVYLGWVHRGVIAQRVFTGGVILVYGLLGVVGWFIDGIALGTSFAIPLAAADNVFHLALAVVGLAIAAVATRR
jgi:hypothetical protein